MVNRAARATALVTLNYAGVLVVNPALALKDASAIGGSQDDDNRVDRIQQGHEFIEVTSYREVDVDE